MHAPPPRIGVRGVDGSGDDQTTSVVKGNAHSQLQQSSVFVCAACSEGDTLLAACDLIGELRRAVAAAEGVNTAMRGRD